MERGSERMIEACLQRDRDRDRRSSYLDGDARREEKRDGKGYITQRGVPELRGEGMGALIIIINNDIDVD